MNRLLVVIFLISSILILTSSTSYGQNDTNHYKRLMVYGQVWGFLKYHHPEPSKRDWDQKLLDDYRTIKECKTDEEFRNIVSSLITLTSSYKPTKFKIDSTNFFKQSFEWLNSTLISENDRNFLLTLLQTKPDFNNKYIKKTSIGTPEIINERVFNNFQDDPAVRYLAITRYWNIINYYYPYRTLIHENWSAIYYECLPYFISADNYDSYYLAVRKISSRINDGHAFTKAENQPILSYKFAPFTCRTTKEGTFINHIKNDNAKAFKIQEFDMLVAINGVSLNDKWKEIEDLFPASNEYYLKQVATSFLTAIKADTIVIKVDRNGSYIIDTLLTISRRDLYPIDTSLQNKKPYEFFIDSLSNKKICYLNMGKLTYKHLDKSFQERLHEVENLIIDSRNYPNWVIYPLTHILIKESKEFAKITEIDFQHPGSVKWRGTSKVGGAKNGYKGAIYILVDYNTMSQAEFTVMALQQHDKTIVIGGQTAGADGNVVEIPLPFGISSSFSGIGIYYPDKLGTQQVGIKRDIEIVQDKHSIENKQDLIYNKAIELIRSR